MYIYLAIALLSAALSGAGAWKVQEWRHGAKEADRLAQMREDRSRREKTIDNSAVAHEKDKTRIKTEFVTITESVEKIIKEPFYVAIPGASGPTDTACLDAGGLRLIAQAIAGTADPAGKPAPALPRPDRPR